MTEFALTLLSGESAITPQNKPNALAVFTEPNAIDPLLNHIRSEIDGFEGDVSTAKGRKDIASMAYKIARSKTAIDGVGKLLTAEQKKIPALIDATRKQTRETLDKWRDEVRAPLDAWEQVEQARIDGHKAVIAHMLECGEGTINGEPAAFGSLISEVEGITVDESFEEFEAEAHRTKESVLTKLRAEFEEHQKREAEKAELERLRAEQAQREQAEREARIAKESEERARKASEAKAAEEIRQREIAAQKEREAAEKRELELKLAAEQAQRAAAEAEAKAKREQQEAQERAQQEAERRAADSENRVRVNGDAIAALVAAGIGENTATDVVDLISEDRIPNISIQY